MRDLWHKKLEQWTLVNVIEEKEDYFIVSRSNNGVEVKSPKSLYDLTRDHKAEIEASEKRLAENVQRIKDLPEIEVKVGRSFFVLKLNKDEYEKYLSGEYKIEVEWGQVFLVDPSIPLNGDALNNVVRELTKTSHLYAGDE